jgi:Abortive infection C-terminus
MARPRPLPSRSGPDSSDGVRRILGAVTTIANGLAELRNRGLGTGHGPATARVGLGSRHAHLAVNAALTWCQLMLDTLADPDAHGEQVSRKRRSNEDHENNQIRSVADTTLVCGLKPSNA